MHSLSRLTIKTSLIFLSCGLLIGAHMSATWFIRRIPPNPFLIVAHTHLLLVGFVLMMIMGVGLWMFPKPSRDDRRYKPQLAWAVYVIVATATAIRATGEISTGFGSTSDVFIAMSTIGGLLQAFGGLLFAANIWTRIRSVGVPLPAPRASTSPPATPA